MSNDFDEKVFRKMGFYIHKTDSGEPLCWVDAHGKNVIGMAPQEDGMMNYLESISSNWEVCAKYLVPFMRERDWRYEISDLDATGHAFWWFDEINGYGHKCIAVKDDNIALAACEAFMEVELCDLK